MASRFLVRVWLPDNPGALGRVASAIGSVGASLVGIDILEQGGGWAIDELVVDAVESDNAQEKLVVALMLISGVSVENVRADRRKVLDQRLVALEGAVEIVNQDSFDEALSTVVERVMHDLAADWCCLVKLDGTGTNPVRVSGDAPSSAWTRAFVEGSRAAANVGSSQRSSDDTAWAEMPRYQCALVAGRTGRPFRSREHVQLEAFAAIADRLFELLD